MTHVSDTVVNSAIIYEMNDFRLGTTSRGTANIQIGASATDDSANGILISSVAQNITTNYGTNNYSISMIATNANGSYRIACYKAGNENNKNNCNLAGAYFPYSSWLGGHFRNSTNFNGGTNDLLTGSPSLVWGVNVLDMRLTPPSTTQRSLVSLTNLGINSQTDGILIVNHGKDASGDGNYAVSFANLDGTWTVRVMDHTGGGESDPMAFVFIPKTNTTVISGKFKGTDANNNLILMYSGNSPAFAVTNIGGGRWDLKIPGYGPTNGVLILSGEGGGSQNPDNCYTYQPYADGSGWEIQSRDLPGGGLQTPDSGTVPICDFVFIPGPTPGVTVTPTKNLRTTESGGTATFTVVLDSKPAANVTINVASSDTTEGTVDQPSLTFTPSNWETPQIVTVTGVDDPDQDGTQFYTIVLSPAVSTDPNFNGIDPTDVSALNIDNEPGITITKGNVTTTEAGGSDTFDVFLNTAPTDNVSFNISSSNTGEGTVSASSLTFTPANWNIPQTVTVTGANDAVDDGDIAYTIVTSAATSTDPVYNGFNPVDVAAVNIDNDTASLSFSQTSGLIVSESGTTTNFTVVLTSQPTNNVTVNIASADTSEGVVSPTSRTFTPVNWATPQSFTLTGIDDAVNDGNISYNLNVTVTSSDAVYASKTATLAATTLDNEAALILPSGTLYYGIGSPGISIDGLATVSDPDTADYNSGSLSFTLTANGSSDDRLEIRNVGTGAGQIGTSGNTVTYGGASIGTFTGGVGTTPLIVSFNASSTPAAAQELIRNVTFRNVNSSPSTAPRTLSVALADGDGGTSSASKQIVISLVNVSDFQDGADHGFGVYSNETDIELWDLNPDSAYPAGSDAVNGLQFNTPDNQVLLRFDSIIGNGPGQIPSTAIVISADLMLDVNVSGSGTPLYQMLVPWDGTNQTYNSMGAGVDLDNVEASNAYTSQIGTFPLSGATTVGTITVSVLPDVQAWQNGLPNYGWVLPGWQGGTRTVFSPSEATNVLDHPRLVVKWVPAGTSSASFRQGVNGYTDAHDTSLRKGAPDTDRSAVAGVFVDAEVTSPNNDPEEPLLRFDNIFGSNPGQVPPGANIQAAILDLVGLFGDAMGDGGHVHAMLVPWQDTSTWNSMNNGVSADGVEAVVAPSFNAGNASLSPDVQGGFLTFDVTADVQAWGANVRPNYGWVFLPWPQGGNGWGWGTAEATAANARPQLRIYYTGGTVGTPIHITSIVRGASTATIQFTGGASTTFSVQRATVVNGSYTSIGSASTDGSGNGTFTDNSPPAGAAFYRISSP